MNDEFRFPEPPNPPTLSEEEMVRFAKLADDFLKKVQHMAEVRRPSLLRANARSCDIPVSWALELSRGNLKHIDIRRLAMLFLIMSERAE